MIELISKLVNTSEGEMIVHMIACSEGNCKHNSNGQCICNIPKIVKMLSSYRAFMVNQPEFVCHSYEKWEETVSKEESKMSNVKITYKPVDKKAKVDQVLRLSNGYIYADLADKIDAIYNAKEEDGEIKSVEIAKGQIILRARSGGICSPSHIYIDCEDHHIGHAIPISKQEAHDLGQALIKMSEQL